MDLSAQSSRPSLPACVRADLKPANILLAPSPDSPSGVVAKLAVSVRTLYDTRTAMLQGRQGYRIPHSLSTLALCVRPFICPAGLWSVSTFGRRRHTRVQLQLRNTLLCCTRGGVHVQTSPPERTCIPDMYVHNPRFACTRPFRARLQHWFCLCFAPLQVLSEHRTCPASDIFALGVLMW